MSNPYQPPLPEAGADESPKPIWRSALAGWLVGLIAGAVVAFPLFPWLHALLLTLMAGAATSTVLQLRVVLREMRQ